MVIEILRYLHIMSLAMWFGGLFGYVLIVWPSIMQTSQPAFPRQLLSTIAMRTAPWIYLAMFSAVLTALIFLVRGFDSLSLQYKLLYLLALLLLAGNNVYGSVVAWPKIMLSPTSTATKSWSWFYFRMAASLVGGLALLSIAIMVI